MTQAVIVSVARTPIGKAYKGAFNNLEAPSLSAVAVKAAIERAGIQGSEVDDCVHRMSWCRVHACCYNKVIHPPRLGLMASDQRLPRVACS